MLTLALFVSQPALAADHRVLVLGNSYIFQADVDQRLDPLLEAAVPAWSDVEVQSLTSGGLTLADHLAYAQDESSAWWQALSSGEERWDTVVIQDQSQIPGFPQDNSSWIASRDAAVALAGLAADRGAQTVLLLTWGREEGDSTNPDLYPDFETMQERLTDGYLAYAQAIAEAGYTVSIAPAGPAFGLVHDSDAELFAQLYHYDGNHPSPWGGTLAALALAGAISGWELDGSAAPADVPAEDFGALVAAAAAVTVEAPCGVRPLAWAHDSWSGEVAGSGVRPTVRAAAGSGWVIGDSGPGRWWVTGPVGLDGDLDLGAQGWLHWAAAETVQVLGSATLTGTLEPPDCPGPDDLALLTAADGITGQSLPEGLVLDAAATTLGLDCDGDGSFGDSEAAADGGAADGGAADGGAAGGQGAGAQEGGCGCSAGGASGGLLVALLPLLPGRRRPLRA